MSNQNTIIAIAKDTPYAATTYDGSVWNVTDTGSSRWKSIHGSGDAFIYTQIDDTNRLCLKSYSITDMVEWHAGVIPTPPMDCIIAIADGQPNIYTSFNGTSFSIPSVVTPVTHEIHAMAVSKTNAFCIVPFQVICEAVSITYAEFERVVSYFREVIATSTTIASALRRFLW